MTAPTFVHQGLDLPAQLALRSQILQNIGAGAFSSGIGLLPYGINTNGWDRTTIFPRQDCSTVKLHAQIWNGQPFYITAP